MKAMQAQHFKSDKRLWFYFGLVVFAALWFVPMIPFPDETVRPCVCWIAIFKTPTEGGWAWKDWIHLLGELPGVLLVTLVMSLLLSIPSLVAGWVLQAVVVFFRQTKTEGHYHAAKSRLK
jgi:hypothetical protein